jgi:hypothetical protein
MGALHRAAAAITVEPMFFLFLMSAAMVEVTRQDFLYQVGLDNLVFVVAFLLLGSDSHPNAQDTTCMSRMLSLPSGHHTETYDFEQPNTLMNSL